MCRFDWYGRNARLMLFVVLAIMSPDPSQPFRSLPCSATRTQFPQTRRVLRNLLRATDPSSAIRHRVKAYQMCVLEDSSDLKTRVPREEIEKELSDLFERGVVQLWRKVCVCEREIQFCAVCIHAEDPIGITRCVIYATGHGSSGGAGWRRKRSWA